MPQATNTQVSQDTRDDLLIRQALDPHSNLDFCRDLEPGEKADDAVDYEDLDDDDLAEDDGVHSAEAGSVLHEGNGPTADLSLRDVPFLQSKSTDNEFDELFGEASPPPPNVPETPLHPAKSPGQDASAQRLDTQLKFEYSRSNFARVQDRQFSKEQQLQEELFALSGSGSTVPDALPEPPANHEELLAALWPKFERNATPNFMDLLPPKKAKYIGKQRPRPPKPLNPTKINLEIAQDQEKAFKFPSGPGKRIGDEQDYSRTVAIRPSSPTEQSGDDEADIGSNEEASDIQGLSWQDLQIICEDWDLADGLEPSRPLNSTTRPGAVSGDVVFEKSVEDLEQNLEEPPIKVSLLSTIHIAHVLKLHDREGESTFMPAMSCSERLGPFPRYKILS